MEDYQLVQDFAAANIPTTTDFEIRAGDHTWKVHSAVLSKKSGYFRALDDGNWSEKETRSVTLKESRPVDVARMLQFIYTGEWRYGADGVGSNDSLTLRSLLSSAGTSADVETNIFDVSRIYAIKKEMFNVASYFDIPTLRANIATMLFDRLNMYTEESGDCLQYFMRTFKEIFDLLQPYLGESDQMKEIETRIVKILIEWRPPE